jgi:hypothetical protein
MVFIFCLLVIFAQVSTTAQVFINEFMAANSTAIYDPDNNESADWIELYNDSTADIDLSGCYLTDNLSNSDKWILPQGSIIQGKSFLLIWADATNQGMHTSFKLSSDGEELGLYDTSLNLVDGFIYQYQETDISYGRQSDGDTIWSWFLQSSPGYSNDNSYPYSGITYYEAKFSLEGGFYENPLSVALTSLGGVIHYTLDGSAPLESDSVYTSAIAIDQSMALRARIFQNNFIPGPVITHSYFYEDSLDLRALPVVSLITNPEYFWDPDSGIYVQNFKPEWEYPLNIEFFENDGNNRAVFNETAGVKVNGLYSWQLPQKMLGIYFRNEYGNNNLDYPLFHDRKRNSYNEIILRAGGSDWSYTLFRDGLGQSLAQENAAINHQGFRPSMVYINGEYMGIHNLRSRTDEAFIEDNYQLEAGTFDLIENDGIIEAGSDDQYIVLKDLFDLDLSIQANFDTLNSMVDIVNFTDYWITEIWCGNISWGHNVKLWKPHNGDKWQFILVDMDRGFADNNLPISEFSDPSGGSSYDYAREWLESIFENDLYAEYFVRRFNDHVYTAFHPRRINEKIDTFRTQIINEMTYHVNRWAGTSSNYGDGIESMEFWEEEIIGLRRFTEERHIYIMDDLQSSFNLGSILNLSTAAYPEEAGKIKLNQFYIPDLPWNGPCFEQISFQLSAESNPGFDFEGWSHMELHTLIALMETWKYHDLGQNLGVSWTAVAYNDDSWSSGQAELGYGDGDETTVVSYGGNSQNKYITTYFRKQFLYTGNQDYLGCILKIRRDDGAIVYLNGIEIARSNLSSDSIDFETEAIEAVASDAEDQLLEFFVEYPILSDTNVIAVEIHQVSGESSDISFDLSFSVQIPSDTIFSTADTLDLSLTQDTGFIARYIPTGECILPGLITVDTTLSSDCSPYLASGNLIVLPDVTLTIDTGVQIWFPTNAQFKIQGDLQVNGTLTAPVLFRANHDHGDLSWGNVYFDHCSGISNLNHLEIKDATSGTHPIHESAAISVRNSEVTMDYLMLNENFADPIYGLYSDITLTNSKVHSDIAGDLINVKYGYSTISNCTFLGNDRPDTDAIDYDGVVNGVISNSSIEGFRGFNSDGIDLGEESSNILIENCFINDITDKGISIGQKSTALIRNNTIVNCNLGVGIKDQSEAVIDHLTSYSNVIAVSAFEKNPGFGGAEVAITNSILSNSSISPMKLDSYSTGIANYNFYDSDLMTGASNTWMNPHFVNPTNYDFHLLPTSGALNAGSDGANLGTLNHQFTASPKIMFSDIQYFHQIVPNKEFIKLYNPGPDPIDLSGFSISGGIEFIFPAGSGLNPNEKVTIVHDSSLFSTMTGDIYEWTSGQLSNQGEMILLTDSSGIVIDHVLFIPAAPWPLCQNPDDYITLFSPDLDNHFGSSWMLYDPLYEPPVTANNCELHLYPNPASSYITIVSGSLLRNIQVYDMTGRQLISHIPNSSHASIKISELKSGIYIVIVNNLETVKFVKH